MATVRDLVRLAVRAAESKKAQDVKAIDVRGLSSVTDYMIVCSGSSDTNVRAIAEVVREQLGEKGERPFSVEGLQEGTWVLLDYVDYVIHVFLAETRLYYGIEELWADARPVPVPAAGAKTAKKTAAAAAPATKAPAAKEALPAVPRAAVKPAGKKSAVPKKKATTKTPAPKKARVPKKKIAD
jgi:ribosome-associated protein